jgi:hypothetical protein
MKYLKVIRNLHLWLGLFLTVFLLVEAVTGLILSEPSFIGVNKVQHVSQSSQSEGKISAASLAGSEQDAKGIEHAKQVSGDVSLLVFIKQLHQGIFSSDSFRWIVELTAIGIIILTVTGVYISIPLLKAQFKSKS